MYHYLNITDPEVDKCSALNFDKTDIEICDKFVYENPEITIVQDVRKYSLDVLLLSK